ncbi:MBL fold metallo-hydrolase [Kiloniella laminariae]|uniref:MBL fold metallo-hydrolase n=1 Tax=Kiloniella laminariae TaxID=454162 RepID=A0ABT4LK21_9PROT|nr:MBL fold metallo-hydrolase [Kiloniella laminariae]MCZ4281452.1 MBL fold metallo-hydrolase [Kiloniella laminariae]
MSVKIQFCGAAGTVTGSCYWFRTPKRQFLVDCGLFQGSKTVKELNYGAFPFKPEEIDFVFLTHAHTDHAGLLPKLTKLGFKGEIFMTSGSRDLLSYMLPDSAHIQESEVKRLNFRNRQRGKPVVEPIYTKEDVENCLQQINTVSYEKWFEVSGIQARFWNAGHILGSASIELKIPDTQENDEPLHLLFSGDIGPEHKSFHPDPDAPSDFDYVFCESTYGGRKRTDYTPEQRRDLLAKEIQDAMSGGGSLLIPSFAVERTQELLNDLSLLLQSDVIEPTPVFIDSPLAIRVTSVFTDHAQQLEDVGSHRGFFNNPSFHFTESVEESKAIARFSSGAIILAASGMCDAGRIRHHLKNHLWRPQSTILLVGYQAEGTLGRLLQQGVEKVKIQGEEIIVRANIRTLDSYSGHADGEELLEWVRDRLPVKQRIFLTHGNTNALAAMKKTLLETGLAPDKVIIPQLDDCYNLSVIGEQTRQQETVRRIESSSLEKPDWHNDLAQFSLDVRTALDKANSDKQRQVILSRLIKALE